jgi:hypothetical protein
MNPTIGKHYRTDSGLGGAFDVIYTGRDHNGQYIFRVTNSDFTHVVIYVMPEQLAEKIREAGPFKVSPC